MNFRSLILICAVGMAFGQNGANECAKSPDCYSTTDSDPAQEPECQAYFPQYCSADKCEPLECEFPMEGPLKFMHNYIEGHWIGACGLFPSKGGVFEFVCPSEPKLPIPKELRHAP